jgi:hypothetical protein
MAWRGSDAQMEMPFTFASSVFFFGEGFKGMEIAGCLLVVGGIVALIFLRRSASRFDTSIGCFCITLEQADKISKQLSGC